MRKSNLVLILFILFTCNINTPGQENETQQGLDQALNVAEEFVPKIISTRNFDVEFHDVHFNIDESPNSYVFICTYWENGIWKTLTLNLSASSPYSINSFYYSKPFDERILKEYERIIVTSRGLMLKVEENLFLRYPDYKEFSMDELLNPSEESFKHKKAHMPETEDVEYIIENVPIYRWYINCALTVDMMEMAYWNDRGYSTLIPGGNSQNGFYWAVGEESCFWAESPDTYYPRTEYYAQAAEYGNNIPSEENYSSATEWDNYQSLIDTHNEPVSVGWQGQPYGAHGTLGVGYRIVDEQRFFILHDTWYTTPSYVSYDEYFESVSGYGYWHPTSDPEMVPASPPQFKNQNSKNEIILYPKLVKFEPELNPQIEAYHHFELADLNGDHIQDFIICNFRNNSGLKLLLYHGSEDGYILDQEFNPVFDWFECLNVSRAVDFDSDGDLDIVLTGYWSKVRIFVNNEGVINPEPIVIDDQGRGFIDLDYGDFDLDGDIDIMASTSSGVIRIYENNNNAFSLSHELPVEGQSFKLRFIDINNDKLPDIVASKRDGTIVIYENHNGAYSDIATFAPPGHGGMSFTAGDIDNNGWKDIVTVRDGELILYKNNQGHFNNEPTAIASPECYPKDICLEDIDNDSLPELVVVSFNRPNFILKNIDGQFIETPAWISDKIEPTFSINIFNDTLSKEKLVVYGKSRGGKIEFFEAKAIEEYNIAAIVTPAEGGAVSGAGSHDYGHTCKLTATSKPGYHFTNWTEDGIQISEDSVYSFVVTADRTLLANFDLKTFIVAADIYPAEGGIVSGAGSYDYGHTCKLTATSKPGYHFSNWTEDGIQISEDSVYSFVVTADRTLLANFEYLVNQLESVKNFKYNIYPNPTTGMIYIECGKLNRINVSNISGQVVLQEYVNADKTIIDLSKQVKGIYMIELITKDKILTYKIILK